jgi:hypothetical protein
MHSLLVLDQVDLITFLYAKFTHKVGGQTDRQIIPPFGDSHLVLSRHGEMAFHAHPSYSKSRATFLQVWRRKSAHAPSHRTLVLCDILKNHPVHIDPTDPSTNEKERVPQQASLPSFRRNGLKYKNFINIFNILLKRQQIGRYWRCG